ncbi:MAG: DUF5615 family PIN-like protein [Nitrospira sp.]|nr:DUF5615 family PIN-like protein [Nitrospira sp.]MDE0404570.1 DUF5615 family PIN-like protein [Nitrospira sp.]MDE0486834.1 DUF5615 family PIN-like protein [Nitrospira sp.]
MKFLFDENLSPRLVDLVATTFPGSTHVRDVGLAQADDVAVWSFAKNNGFVIVTKDADFRQMSFMSGFPPKVIWIQRGNCTTIDVVVLLQRHHSELHDFESNTEAAFLEIG